jgi:hypothetical protein
VLSIFKRKSPILSNFIHSTEPCFPIFPHNLLVSHIVTTSLASPRVSAAPPPLLPLATHRHHSKAQAHLPLFVSTTCSALLLLLYLTHLPSKYILRPLLARVNAAYFTFVCLHQLHTLPHFLFRITTFGCDHIGAQIDFLNSLTDLSQR